MNEWLFYSQYRTQVLEESLKQVEMARLASQALAGRERPIGPAPRFWGWVGGQLIKVGTQLKGKTETAKGFNPPPSYIPVDQR